jgi:hypothetical protein
MFCLSRSAFFPSRTKSSSFRIRELPHKARRVVDRKIGEPGLYPAGHGPEDAQVRLDDIRNPGPLDLERHHRAVLQHRPVDLGEGCGRQRLLVDRGEDLPDGAGDLLDDRPDLGEGEGGAPVGEKVQLLDQSWG